MSKTSEKYAVIYCRVSSKSQTKRGDGLGSQETRCREHARYRGYIVEEVFKDDMTGSLIDRPGMKAMLKYLRKNKSNPRVAIIDDISRLARSVDAHIQLRSAIASAGGILESPSIEFGDDSDSELQEFIMATVAQHQRKKNAEQTVNRMKSRVMNGYYVFSCPLGYKYKLTADRGNILIPDEQLAPIIKEALEGYASGRFQIQAEVKRFLESQPAFPKSRNGTVIFQRVTDILKRVVYAGYVEAPCWGVSLRKGHHEPLIDFSTYQKIQDRLEGNAKTPARKDLNEDFPLRGTVLCGCCNTPLTACWSKGRYARYAYYHCPKKGCESYGKSIKRDVIEGEFEDLLNRMQPTQGLLNIVNRMFKAVWDCRMHTQKEHKQAIQREIKKIEQNIEQFLDRIADAESATVMSAYEKRIQKLEKEKITMQEKLAMCGRPIKGYDDTLRTAIQFLSNPCILWSSERLEDKRAVLKLTFADRLEYVRNEGFRTAKTTLPFRHLDELSTPQLSNGARFGFVIELGWGFSNRVEKE